MMTPPFRQLSCCHVMEKPGDGAVPGHGTAVPTPVPSWPPGAVSRRSAVLAQLNGSWLTLQREPGTVRISSTDHGGQPTGWAAVAGAGGRLPRLLTERGVAVLTFLRNSR